MGRETWLGEKQTYLEGNGKELQVGLRWKGKSTSIPRGRKSPAEREEARLGGDIVEGELIGNKTKIRAGGRP